MGLLNLGVQQQLGGWNAPVSRRPTLPRRRAWTRWRYSMPAKNLRCGASKPRSSFPAHSPAAPITSAHSGTPGDKQRVAEYEAGPYKGWRKENPGSLCRHCSGGCGCGLRGGRNRYVKSWTPRLAKTPVPRPYRPDPGRGRCGICSNQTLRVRKECSIAWASAKRC